MNDEMVDDFVDEPNVPNNAIGGCGCFSFFVILALVGSNIRSCNSPSVVLEQEQANRNKVQAAVYLKEQEKKKQVQEEFRQRVAKETQEQNKLREEQRRVFEATKKQMDEKKSVEMQFLQTKYDSLSEFKDSKQFAEWGFSAIGPFGPWLRDVEAKKSGKFESADVAFAVAHLLTLGLEYKDSKGKETDYSRFANNCIKGILDGQTKDRYERQALSKVQSIMNGESSSQQKSNLGHSPEQGRALHLSNLAFRASLKIKSVSPLNELVRVVIHRERRAIFTVENKWHTLPYQLRLQYAQRLGAYWSELVADSFPKETMFDIVDLGGNHVGGSGITGIWVQK
jgi:hypothetical protein